MHGYVYKCSAHKHSHCEIYSGKEPPRSRGGRGAHWPLVMVMGAIVDQLHNNLEVDAGVFCWTGDILPLAGFKGLIKVIVGEYWFCKSKICNWNGTPFAPTFAKAKRSVHPLHLPPKILENIYLTYSSLSMTIWRMTVTIAFHTTTKNRGTTLGISHSTALETKQNKHTSALSVYNCSAYRSSVRIILFCQCN